MKLFTKSFFIFLLCMLSIQSTQAQKVTQAWATLASDAYLGAIAIDASGNVYTDNGSNKTVSKITSSGTVTQAWATLASIPTSIAVDGSGNVYTGHYNDNTVSKITSSGTVTQAWATLASGASPLAIAIDGSGNVYTANYSNSTVSKITAVGIVTQAWATLASGATPGAIAIDASGNVYTANYNNTVSKITSDGTVTQVWATLASNAFPDAIAIDASGNVYTANYNNTVSKITSSGTVSQAWATLASDANPAGIAIDGSGNIYTANFINNTVSKITGNGTVTQAWATLASGVYSDGIAIDGWGNVYTANSGNSTVSKIAVNNTWTGTTNTAWATATNWDFGTVPVSTDDVIIPSTTNMPIISNSTTALLNNLTINTNASLTVNGKLTITGTGTNNGTLTVAPGAALINSNAISNVVLQQNIIAQRGWRVFANPFSTDQTIATVAGNNVIPISTTANAGSGLTDSRTFVSNAWANVTGTTWLANTPYALFIRGLSTDLSGGTGLTYLGSGPTAFTYNVSGTLNGASVSVPQTSGNFAIVGNPYAAPVTTQALTGGTSKTYYTYKISGTGTPKVTSGSWVASGTASNTSTTIPVLGVVAYSATSSSSFNVTAATDINTTPTPQANLFGTEAPASQLELLVEQNGYYKDKLFVRLDTKSTSTGIDNTDLPKLYNDNVNVYTINTTDNTRMAIDARNALNTIPLGISALAGDYNFKLSNNSLPEGTTVTLTDKLLNTNTTLKVGDVYNFSVTSDAASHGEQRFALSFSAKTTAAVTDPATSLTATVLGNVTSANQIAVQIAGAAAPVTIAVKDMNGKAIKTINAVNGIQYVNVGNTAAGMLILQISDGKNSVTKKVIKL